MVILLSTITDEQNRVRTIGAVVRTREKSKPLDISPGHMINLENTVSFLRADCQGYCLPEPIRRADQLSKAIGLSG